MVVAITQGDPAGGDIEILNPFFFFFNLFGQFSVWRLSMGCKRGPCWWGG